MTKGVTDNVALAGADDTVPQISGKSDTAYGVGGGSHAHRRFKARHITWISLAGGAGVGFSVGTGTALATAGPAGLLLAAVVVGGLLLCVMESIGELASLFPTVGSFPHLCSRFIDPAIGFTLAISYGYCCTMTIATQLTSAAEIISNWTNLNSALVITVSLMAILAVNMASLHVYGEAEVVFAFIKGLCYLGLIIVSLIITLHGTPNSDRIGFRHWIDPGPFTKSNEMNNKTSNFLSTMSVFIDVGFSFIGIETILVSATEATDPNKSILMAIKRVRHRILFFDVLGAFLIGMTIPSNEPDLIRTFNNLSRSPFYLVLKNSAIPVLDSIVNACILTSAWSASNGSCYVGTRMITTMVIDHQAPHFFVKANRWGVPYYAVLGSLFCVPLAYLDLGSDNSRQAFTLLQNSSTTVGLLAWATICICFLRYERACRVQGIDRRNLPFKGLFQPFTAYIGAIGSVIVVLFSGFKGFISTNWSTSDLVSYYIGILVYLVPFTALKLVKKTTFVRSSKADLITGRHEPSSISEKESTSWWGKIFI
ncbi:hypothetical protein K3495_g1063 [Podosphaera aphanis]|nr:hypothetical protein K3495_g1063 [Podosphaera aphanis]